MMDPADGSFNQNPEVTALIAALKSNLSVYDPAGPATRQHLKETAEQLSLALETPGETVQRVAYYVSVLSIHVRLNRWSLILVDSRYGQPSFA